jgi:hypothetical protein
MHSGSTRGQIDLDRHCEKRSDEAIHLTAFVEEWIASLRSQ